MVEIDWLKQARDLLERSLHPILTELNELDWKEDISPDGERLKQHLSAFASYPGGGFLVFGIDRQGGLVGVTNEQVEVIVSKLGNLARQGLEPAIQLSHATDSFKGRPLLFVRIPESLQKPVQLKGRPLEDSFIRSVGQTRKMSRQELGQALLNSRVPRYEELEAYYSDSPAEILEKLDIPALYSLLGRQVPSREDLLIEELVSQRLITFTTKRVAITNLGVLICAKNMAEFQGHERRGVRVIFYRGKSRVDSEREIVGKKGYAIAFQGMVQYIVSHLPSSEVIQGALRKKVSVYPEITIRELLANAIVHQDLSMVGQSPMVEVFSDRMEITNPGKLLPSISVDRIIDTTPESRNEPFARFMRQVGICEERGSGIDRALQAVELFGLPPLEFTEGENSFKAALYTPKKYKEMGKEERVRACYQHCVLKFVCNERMNNSSLRQRLGIAESNYPMISRIIKDSLVAVRIKLADPSSKSNRHAQYIPYWA